VIEKDLLERQSKVLEKIILSHEHVSQWKEFVQEILLDFIVFFRSIFSISPLLKNMVYRCICTY